MSQPTKKVQIIFPSGKKGGYYPIKSSVKLKGENFWRRVNTDGTLTKIEDGKNGTFNYARKDLGFGKQTKKETEKRLRLANKVDPHQGYPSGLSNGYRIYKEMKQGDPTQQSYKVYPTLGDSVAQAAWKKYLGLNYDTKFLPQGVPDDRGGFGNNTVRLPAALEAEIPVDTAFLKERIEKNMDYLNNGGPKSNDVIDALKFGIDQDEYALNQLRKTYSTGEPVGLHENQYNSRQLINDGIVDWNILEHTPLNVLQFYNIRYDKDTNRMYYSDTYGFDNATIPWPANWILGTSNYDEYLGGNPFRFRGYIDLDKK